MNSLELMDTSLKGVTCTLGLVDIVTEGKNFTGRRQLPTVIVPVLIGPICTITLKVHVSKGKTLENHILKARMTRSSFISLEVQLVITELCTLIILALAYKCYYNW